MKYSLIPLFSLLFFSCQRDEDTPDPEPPCSYIECQIEGGDFWKTECDRSSWQVLESGDTSIFLIQGFNLVDSIKREITFFVENGMGKFNLNSSNRVLFREGRSVMEMNSNYHLSDSGFIHIKKLSPWELSGDYEAFVKNPNTLDTIHLVGNFSIMTF